MYYYLLIPSPSVRIIHATLQQLSALRPGEIYTNNLGPPPVVFQNVTPLKFQHQKNHELHNLANFEKIITFGLFCGKIVKKYFALIFIFFCVNFLRFPIIF